jgi:hypothetical protein
MVGKLPPVLVRFVPPILGILTIVVLAAINLATTKLENVKYLLFHAVDFAKKMVVAGGLANAIVKILVPQTLIVKPLLQQPQQLLEDQVLLVQVPALQHQQPQQLLVEEHQQPQLQPPLYLQLSLIVILYHQP